MVFKPKPSFGWVWLVPLGGLLTGLPPGAVLAGEPR